MLLYQVQTLLTMVTWQIMIRIWESHFSNLEPNTTVPIKAFRDVPQPCLWTWENTWKEITTYPFLRSVQNCYYHLIFITFTVQKKLPATKPRLRTWNMTWGDSHSDGREVSSLMWNLKTHYFPYLSVFAGAHKWIYPEQAERSPQTHTHTHTHTHIILTLRLPNLFLNFSTSCM
jgi:hypothetical protein